MGIVLQFTPRPFLPEDDLPDGDYLHGGPLDGASGLSLGVKPRGQLIMFPGTDFARIMPSLSALEAEFDAGTPRAEEELDEDDNYLPELDCPYPSGV